MVTPKAPSSTFFKQGIMINDSVPFTIHERCLPGACYGGENGCFCPKLKKTNTSFPRRKNLVVNVFWSCPWHRLFLNGKKRSGMQRKNEDLYSHLSKNKMDHQEDDTWFWFSVKNSIPSPSYSSVLNRPSTLWCRKRATWLLFRTLLSLGSTLWPSVHILLLLG